MNLFDALSIIHIKTFIIDLSTLWGLFFDYWIIKATESSKESYFQTFCRINDSKEMFDKSWLRRKFTIKNFRATKERVINLEH